MLSRLIHPRSLGRSSTRRGSPVRHGFEKFRRCGLQGYQGPRKLRGHVLGADPWTDVCIWVMRLNALYKELTLEARQTGREVAGGVTVCYAFFPKDGHCRVRVFGAVACPVPSYPLLFPASSRIVCWNPNATSVHPGHQPTSLSARRSPAPTRSSGRVRGRLQSVWELGSGRGVSVRRTVVIVVIVVELAMSSCRHWAGLSLNVPPETADYPPTPPRVLQLCQCPRRAARLLLRLRVCHGSQPRGSRWAGPGRALFSVLRWLGVFLG